jgi:hypothetical protein
VDEIIFEGVRARREKERTRIPGDGQKTPKKNLVELFAESPFSGSEVGFEL